MARDDRADAKCLRQAAGILRARGRQTFAITVIIKVLNRSADQADRAAEWREFTGEGVELVQYEDLTGVSSGLWRA